MPSTEELGGGGAFGPQEQAMGFAGVLYSSQPLGDFLNLLRCILTFKLESSFLECFLRRYF